MKQHTCSKGTLFVISGPSGAGKGTLVARLVERIPELWVSISATTRLPRVGEQDGVQYFFFSKKQFEDYIARDGFIEWAKVHGNYYGTPLSPIRKHLDAAKSVVLEIDVQGAFQVREKFSEAQLIFIAPPSIEVLEQRLRARGTDDEDAIVRRMANAQSEMQQAAYYDHVIVNDDLDKATNELVSMIQSLVS